MDCCGCGACVEICPKKCIELIPDIEGFLYPKIREEECMKCGLCKKVCPVNYVINENNKNSMRAFVGINKQESVVFESSSGGAYTSIFKYFIKQGFLVYGVKWGNNFKVIYDFATDIKACEEFRKSKYILSDTNHFFEKIVCQLKNGKKVLFSGTPCHCAALHLFLDVKKVSTENIFFIDIICHGAPNQKLFDSYIEETNIRNRNGIQVSSYTFRCKKPFLGVINSRTAEIIYDDGTEKIVDAKTDPFLKGYYNRLFYRKSCEKCSFANISRVTDMTIGDAWHIEDLYPEWDSHSGVSLILLNTERAKSIAVNLLKGMTCKEISLDWAIKNNSQLKTPTTMHKNRNLFFQLYRTKGFYTAVDKCIPISYMGSIKRLIKRIIYDFKEIIYSLFVS